MIGTKKKPPQGTISTASMPDIIFMLLIFFMTSTVFVEFRGLPVKIPSTDNAQKIEGKRNLAYCFVDINERVSVDDKLLTPKEVTSIMYLKRTSNPRIIVSLKIDENCKNDIVDQVQRALQEADARRIVYATKTK
ncbi:MAG: biopolymer transporter ExbD [Candidatus Delongbacteria bacterium]|jgi:biopolymer transport protein ExbD|nr:biopolymer transporter ExbD [Candidatus Delongbacteria bacterium]MDD4205539.1 biopolymer transporter ExbD [Candidatus Delongbacteria bacterium]MDY0017904.1 biopolymer transporter ExbD [Candidatus Delongbacteria bacterium]